MNWDLITAHKSVICTPLDTHQYMLCPSSMRSSLWHIKVLNQCPHLPNVALVLEVPGFCTIPADKPWPHFYPCVASIMHLRGGGKRHGGGQGWESMVKFKRIGMVISNCTGGTRAHRDPGNFRVDIDVQLKKNAWSFNLKEKNPNKEITLQYISGIRKSFALFKMDASLHTSEHHA